MAHDGFNGTALIIPIEADLNRHGSGDCRLVLNKLSANEMKLRPSRAVFVARVQVASIVPIKPHENAACGAYVYQISLPAIDRSHSAACSRLHAVCKRRIDRLTQQLRWNVRSDG